MAYRSSSVAATRWSWRRSSPSRRAGGRRGAGGGCAAIVTWRREHQPGGSNAGSVFTNPEGDSAGRLIEAAGLKGYRLGTAHVSEKHANFIQADEDGRADDVARSWPMCAASWRSGAACACGPRSASSASAAGMMVRWTGTVRGVGAEAGARHDARGTTERRPPRRNRPRPSAARRASAPHRPADLGPADSGPPGQGQRRLIIAGSVLGGGRPVVGGWFLLHTPLFSARSVTVTGNVHETAAQVVAQAGRRRAHRCSM